MWVAVAVGAAAGSLACGKRGGGGDDGTEGAPPTLPPAPTVPAEVEPATGVLVLGRASYALRVTSCALAPELDADTGITTDLAVTASGPDDVVVTVVRSSFVADQPTITDTITLAAQAGVRAESRRVDAAGRILDLRDTSATDRLIELDGDIVRATGVFGPVAARGPDPLDADGTLVLRCPPDP